MAINWHDTDSKSIDINFLEAGVAASAEDNCVVADLWTNENLGTFKLSYSVEDVEAHGHRFMRVSC